MFCIMIQRVKVVDHDINTIASPPVHQLVAPPIRYASSHTYHEQTYHAYCLSYSKRVALLCLGGFTSSFSFGFGPRPCSVVFLVALCEQLDGIFKDESLIGLQHLFL
jgi:hypothetical protein